MIDHYRTHITLAIFLLLLSGCGGTGRFIEQPALQVRDAGISAMQAVQTLFLQDSPYTILLCEADRESGTCLPDEPSPRATGLGGIFLPLVMDLDGINIDVIQRDEDALRFSATLDSTVNEIPPACGKLDGEIIVEEKPTARLEIENFFCNWAAIGNVITDVVLSIDSVDPQERTFTGYYSISFIGTGNASGSGYYLARIQDQPRLGGNDTSSNE